MKKIVGIIVLGLLMFSCSDNDVIIENDCDAQAIISSEDYTNTSSTGPTINSIEITDDCLKVSYSAGGCSGDTWELKLIDSEATTKSFPAQRSLMFSLKDEEECEALITKEITFDISNLQIEGDDKVRLNIANLDNSILYLYGENDTTNSRQLITNGIDLDGDGELDFKLDEYEIQTNDLPSSAGSRNIYLEPLEDNELFTKEGARNLFLKVGDIIKNEAEEGFEWRTDLRELIGKSRTFEVYDEFWAIHSDLTDDFYVGIKLIKDTEEKIGWLKLEFDLVTGEVYLLDSVISSSSEIIIE